MFRRIIIIAAFAATVLLLTFGFLKKDSNDKDCSQGGMFRNDKYINTSVGIEVDLADKWVYFDPASMQQLASSTSLLDISSVDLETEYGKYVMFAARPGTVVAVGQAKFTFDRAFLTDAGMKLQAELYEAAFEEAGYNCSITGYGEIPGAQTVSYAQLKYTSGKENGNIIFAFCNTDSCGVMIYGYARSDEDMRKVKDFIFTKIKVTSSASGGGSAVSNTENV